MHPNNKHNSSYNFSSLGNVHTDLNNYVFMNCYGIKTIDFSDQQAVFHLNKAILKKDYNLNDWTIPKNYLCPPIPGRADYIYHLNDLVTEENSSQSITGLDIGVGASCIYPILGSRLYGWNMVGCDISDTSIKAATKNIAATPDLKKTIQLRHQKDPANIFTGIINNDEYYNFTMCNPPFHSSKEEAAKKALKKMKNLKYKETTTPNFGGHANELWCNGGEKLFLKRMIKESKAFKNQVGWFTSLVSRHKNLPKIKKYLKKADANYRIIDMSQGSKKSRIVAWQFD